MNSDFTVAVHALVYLYHKKATVSSEALAKNICTNPARVRKIMSRLKADGLILTKAGRTDGGYSYPAKKEVTLAEIYSAVGCGFFDASWQSGDSAEDCKICSGMSGYMDSLFGELNTLCSSRLQKTTVAMIEQSLCGGRGNSTK